MKSKVISLVFLIGFISLSFIAKNWDTSSEELSTQSNQIDKEKVLRHVVVFKFLEDTSKEDITAVEEAFSALPNKIPEILSYEWGLNNSPEGLEKGFTHCFFLTFKSEEDRAIYLPHPDHKAFGKILTPHLEDVLVFDYWTK